MKKNILLSSIALLSCISLLGCSSSTASDPHSVSRAEVTGDSNSDVISESSNASSLPYSIEENVLIDDDYIKITAMNVDRVSSLGDVINLSIENKTDEDYVLKSFSYLIDDYGFVGIFDCQLPANATTQGSYTLYTNDLAIAKIDAPAKIDMYFDLVASKTLETIMDYDAVTLYTSIYSEDEYSNATAAQDFNGTLLYDKDGLTIYAKYDADTPSISSAVLLYAENHSGEDINITCSDMRVNNCQRNPFSSTYVYDDKYAIDAIILPKNWLEENNITSDMHIVFNFILLDSDGKIALNLSDITLDTSVE